MDSRYNTDTQECSNYNMSDLKNVYNEYFCGVGINSKLFLKFAKNIVKKVSYDHIFRLFRSFKLLTEHAFSSYEFIERPLRPQLSRDEKVIF